MPRPLMASLGDEHFQTLFLENLVAKPLVAGIILYMRPANGKQRYIVMLSLIG